MYTFNPLPTQEKFLKSNHRVKGMFGGWGSGKSKALKWEAISQALVYPGIRGLSIRGTYTELHDTTIVDYHDHLPMDLVSRFTKDPPDIIFKNGSIIHLRSVETNELDKIKSLNLGFIEADELGEFSEKTFYFLMGRLRQKVGLGFNSLGQRVETPIPQQSFFWAHNPEGRDWVWKVMVKEHPQAEDGNDPVYAWWRATSMENAANLPADYLAFLKAMPPHLFRRYVLAEFGEFEGLIYPQFSRDAHVLPLKNWRPPSHWPVYRGIDHGVTRSATVCLWATINPARQIIFFKEYYQKGVENDFNRVLTVREHARNIKAITAQMGVTVHWTVIDPATRAKSGNDAKSVFDWYLAEGVPCILGSRNNDNRNIVKVSMGFQSYPHNPHPISGLHDKAGGYPGIFFTQDCVKCIQEHEEWQWKDQKEDRPDEEKPEEKNDHTCDVVGYVAAQNPTAAGPPPVDTTTLAYRMGKHRRKVLMSDHPRSYQNMGGLLE
jgi:phage terminase large subunit